MAYKYPEVGRARDRERFRRRSAERIAQGPCPRCGERPPAPGRSVCEPCGEKRRAAGRDRDARLRVAGKPRRNPETARASERRRYRRQVAERQAQGICTRCGQAPAAPERTVCEVCGENGVRPIARAMRRAGPPASGMAAEIRRPDAAAPARGAASGRTPAAIPACARGAGGSPSRTTRPAGRAGRRGGRLNARPTPSGGLRASAAGAVGRPRTTVRGAPPAPRSKPNADRPNTRTPQPAGATPSGGRLGAWALHRL